MALWSRGKRTVLKAAAVLALLLGFALPARAVTIHDLIALSQAGLSDQVLIALIQTDQTIYGVDADQVLALRKAGVSESVILALLQNGRATAKPGEKSSAPSAPAASSPDASVAPSPELAPNLTIIGDHSRDQVDQEDASPAQGTVVVQTVVPELFPVPIVVGGHGHRGHRGIRGSQSVIPGYKGFGRFINNGFINGTGAHANIRGSSIHADGWRIVTPRVVPSRVPGQH
jgi:hypothetical protein